MPRSLRFSFLGMWLVTGCGDSILAAEQPLRTSTEGGIDASAEFDADGSTVRDSGIASDTGASPTDAGQTDSPPPANEGGVYVACGHARCRNVVGSVSGAPLEVLGCCADPARSRCGAVVSFSICQELAQPGNLDPTCPTLAGTAVGTLPGCCRPDGTCGVYVESFGVGCSQVPLVSQLSPCTPEK